MTLNHSNSAVSRIKFLFNAALIRDTAELEWLRVIRDRYIVHGIEFPDLTKHVADGWPPGAVVVERHEPPRQTPFDDLEKWGKKLPQELATHFARNLIDALDYLHNVKKLVHRDLKPSNVLIRMPVGKTFASYTGSDSLRGADLLLADL